VAEKRENESAAREPPLLPMRGSDLEQQSGRLIPGKWLDECNYSGTKELHQPGK